MSGTKKRTAVEPVYCSARKTSGDPCRRRPINGGTVCASHGGRAPQVKAAAQRRILAAADRAAAAVVTLMEDRATPHAVKLAAARDLLDRAGLSARAELTVDVLPWQSAIERILVDDPGKPKPDPAMAAQIEAFNAEVTEPAAWEEHSVDPEILEADAAAELVERAATPHVEPATFSSKPPARLADGLTRQTARRRRSP